MKTKKQIPLVDPIEYRLLITPLYDELTKKSFTIVRLRTAKQFSNFRYQIVVRDEVAEHSLRLGIEGLRAPQPSLPGAGAAEFTKEYPDLKLVKEVIVTKLGGEENVFFVDISHKDVKVLKSPKRKFVEIVSHEDEL